jgi:hypothetical protein
VSTQSAGKENKAGPGLAVSSAVQTLDLAGLPFAVATENPLLPYSDNPEDRG